MIEWLKTSLLGIIILGAFGSMLAVAILKITAALLRRFGTPMLKRTLGRALLVTRAPDYVVDYLRSSKDPRELLVTCTFVLAYFVFMVVAMFTAFLTFVVLHVTNSLPYSRNFIIAFGASGLFFTATFFVVHLLRVLTKIYNVHMQQAEAAAIAQAKAEIDDKLNKRA